MSTTTNLRPFHESIVEAIRRCDPSPSKGEILRLFEMIKETKIPKGHDEIIAVIDKFFDFPGGEKWARHVRLVKESVLAQKQVASQKSEKKSVSLEELQQEAEKLMTMSREDGSSGFDKYFQCVEKLHNLTLQVLGR